MTLLAFGVSWAYNKCRVVCRDGKFIERGLNMYSFFSRLRWTISRFMQGRYGIDKMFWGLYILGMVFWLISLFVPMPFISILSTICIFYGFLRCVSRNFYARRRELAAYEKLTAKPRGFFRRQKRRWQDRKTHRYFKCKCGTFLRVPKGKGKIRIHCQKCNNFMIKKT